MDGIVTQCGMVQFATGGVNLPVPIHYWDLDDATSLTDLAGSYDLTPLRISTVTGSPNGGDCVDVPSNGYMRRQNSSWDGATNALEYTFSAWVKFDTLKTGSGIGEWFFSWRDGSPPAPRIMQLLRARSSDKFTGTVISGTSASSFSSTTTPVVNTWFHVVLTADGTTARFFVDGVEEATLDISSFGNIDTGTPDLALGDAAWSLNNSNLNFNGKLSMSGIWDQALTATEVATLYNSGSGMTYSEITA